VWEAEVARRENDKAAYNAKRAEQRQRRLQGERGEIYREKQREQCRKYKQSHRQYFIEYFRKHGQAYYENRRARKRQADGSFTPQEWEVLKANYGYTCLRCGRREPEIKLEADHVVPLAKGGSNSIENIQPLCISCNRSKSTKIIDYRRERA
jgi:5-methylcytosine-specific restriction endonuclease McrA